MHGKATNFVDVFKPGSTGITKISGCINGQQVNSIKFQGVNTEGSCGSTTKQDGTTGYGFNAYPRQFQSDDKTNRPCKLAFIGGSEIDGKISGSLSSLYFYWTCN